MKPRRFVSNELLTSVDVLNTLNGGMNESRMQLKQFPDHREIRVRVPGVSEDKFHAEIHNNVLSVFYTVSVVSDDLKMEVPRVVYSKQIPYFVDTEKISASAEDNLFVVVLPFNSMAQGYHRSVSTEQ